MAEVQERIAKLMSEIHDLCEANGITYYLDERQAVQAVFNHALNDTVLSGKFLMTAEDMKKFIDVFEASPIEGREIEYLKNNGYYPGFHVKYVDTSTVYYNMSRLACERCLGLYVSISVLKPVNLSSKKCQAIEQTWESIAYGGKIIGRKLGPILAYRFNRSIAKNGRDKTASDLFDSLMKEYSKESRNNEYWTVKKTGKKVGKRKNLTLSERITVDLYGHQLYTFETVSDIVKGAPAVLESKYKLNSNKTIENNEMRFADVNISYKDLHLEQFRDSIRPMITETLNIKRKALRVARRRRRLFNVLYKTHARYYYGLLFEKQIDDLERMLREGETEQLEEIMNPYVKDLVKYKNIYISRRVNNILMQHYDLDLDALFKDVPEFYQEGIKIYDYKGNYIRTVAGTKDD